MIEIEIKRVTPEMAKEMLAKNTANRNLRKTKVNSYALQMQAGLWEADSNDPIMLSPDGELLNGQHRLNAVIKAGIPVKMAIRYDGTKKIAKVVDQGAPRSSRDLYTGSVPDKSIVIGGARMMAALRHGASLVTASNGKMQDRAAVPNDWIFSEIDEHEEDYIAASRCANKLYSSIGKGSKSVIIFLIMLTRYVGTGNEIFEFIEDAAKKRPESDPAAVLKDALLRRHAQRLRTTPKEFLGIALYAYEKYRNNLPMAKVKTTDANRTFDKYDAMARAKYEMKVGA